MKPMRRAALRGRRMANTSLYRRSASAVLLVLAFAGHGQWELPGPIILTGQAPDDRQVIGLEAPVAAGDAVSVDAVRTQAYARATVTGTTALIGELVPAPSEYTAGMVVTVIPAAANTEATTLELNGLGPRFIVKQENTPLRVGDLRPGVPVRLIFDGTYFQLVSATHLPCPSGYSSPHHGLCIENDPRTTATFFNAVSACVEQGARLCTLSEWSRACHVLPGFFGTVLEAEWVDHAANYSNGAKLVGVGIDAEGNVGSGCDFGGQNTPSTPARFRCCIDR